MFNFFSEMKKKLVLAACAAIVAAIVAAVCGTKAARSFMTADELFNENVEALASGEVTVTACLGFWNKCTLSDGTESKAPAVSVKQ